jgi:hypothetical protein
MANNRMWLVHRPSGERLYLGKRMGHGWYRHPVAIDGDLNEKIATFFDKAEAFGSGLDAFVLQMEFVPEETPD